MLCSNLGRGDSPLVGRGTAPPTSLTFRGVPDGSGPPGPLFRVVCGAPMRGAGLLIVGVRGAELCATCCGEHPWSGRRMLPDLRANLKRAGRANNRGTAGVPRFAGVLGRCPRTGGEVFQRRSLEIVEPTFRPTSRYVGGASDDSVFPGRCVTV